MTRHDRLTTAIKSYEGVRSLCDGPETLNLSWTLDERACLSIDLDQTLAHFHEMEARSLAHTNQYLVQDPYGESVMRPQVAAFFQIPESSVRVACGAGVISLLAALARTQTRGRTAILGSAYPDFPFWVERSGRRLSCLRLTSVSTLVESVLSQGIGCIFLEHPEFSGEDIGHEDLMELCVSLETASCVVLVDESNANYAPNTYSMVRLVAELRNLIVLRGFSKAYGLGGLRVGYAVLSDTLWEWMTTRVPPLLTSTHSLHLAARILACGDVAAPLRERVGRHKELMFEDLLAADIPHIVRPSPYLPYLLLPATDQASRERLEGIGIEGKRHVTWPGAGGPNTTRWCYRMSVPLSDQRMNRFRSMIRMLRK